MVKEQLRHINDTVCHNQYIPNLCDMASKQQIYTKSWIYSALIDIVLPGAAIGMIYLFGDYLANLYGFILLMGIAIIWLVMHILLFREIGIVMGIALVAYSASFIFVIALMLVSPIFSIIGLLVIVVPWYIIAVYIHKIIYAE